jgi:tetratricopeptide (TPR) repeat protein
MTSNCPHRNLLASIGIALVLGACGCAGDPVVKAQRFVASGDRYLANRQFNEAVIEYGRATQERPEWGEAHYKRAQAYMATDDVSKAFAAYAKAADIDGHNVDAQIQAGTLLLMAGQYEGAQRYAERAIHVAAENAAAHTLLGNALAGLRHTPRAIKEIEQALALDPAYAPAWTALGAAQLRAGARKEAAAAFTRAVALAPASIDARLALAQYHWAAGEIGDAERVLRDALAIDGEHAATHHALALLLLSSRRSDEAEPHFKALARDVDGQLALADYYVLLNRRQRALEVLAPLKDQKNAAHRRAARLRIAAIGYESGDKAGAYRLVDELIVEQPKQEEPKLAKARFLLRDRDATQAARYARDVLKGNSESVPAHYTVGLSALAVNNLAEAESAFRQVTRINPRAAAAHLQLARIHLAQGDAAKAVVASSSATRLTPDDPNTAILMARSLRAAGELTRADRQLATDIKNHPRSAALYLERGALSLERRQWAAAREAFATALQLDPALHDAQAGLVATEIASGSVSQARVLVEGWLKKSPSDSALQVLLAKVQLAAGDRGPAEQTLRDIAMSAPSELEAYDLLGRMYLSEGQLDRAVAEYESLAARSPAAAGPRTMLALIQEVRGDRPAAQAHYLQALRIDPSAGVAANNLAWIYAEEGRLDEALSLATTAQSALRQRPEVEDTLGWIYLKRGDTQRAMTAFENAVAKVPQKGLYHYHLGLAQRRTGDNVKAAAALRQALRLGLSGPDGEAAKAMLQNLQGSTS